MLDCIHVPNHVLVPAAPKVVVKVTAVTSCRKFSCLVLNGWSVAFYRQYHTCTWIHSCHGNQSVVVLPSRWVVMTQLSAGKAPA